MFSKRGLITIAVVAVALAALILSTGRKKVIPVPMDDKHRPFYETMEKGGDRVKEEKKCTSCHNPQTIPLTRRHPPKEQCLICHKLHRPRHG